MINHPVCTCACIYMYMYMYNVDDACTMYVVFGGLARTIFSLHCVYMYMYMCVHCTLYACVSGPYSC